MEVGREGPGGERPWVALVAGAVYGFGVRISKACTLASLALCSWVPAESWAQAEAPPVLAVFPIQDSTGRLDEAALSQLTDYFSVTIAASGRFTIVPKKDLEAALREKKADSYRQCVDQACQIEIGREIAAQKVCQTQVVRLGDQCGVTTAIYDLRTAASEKAAVAKGGCSENDLVSTLERAARDLLGEGAPPPVASPAPIVTPPPVATPTPEPAAPSALTFALRVEAEPEEAEVMIDGRVVGRGSVRSQLTPGETHRLAVRLTGYTSYEEEVSIHEDSRREIVLTMSAETRGERSEAFSFALAFYRGLGTSMGGGLWLQAPAVRFGNFAWTLAEGFLGLHTGALLDRNQDGFSGGEIDASSGLQTDRTSGFLVLLSSRLGYRIPLGASGANVLEVSAGPAFHLNGGNDRTLSDEYIGLSIQPAIRYLRVPEGTMGVGFGLRAAIPLHHSCPFNTSEGAVQFASCAIGNPILFQLELPFGVY